MAKNNSKVAMPALMTAGKIEKEIDVIAHAVGGIGTRLHAVAVQCLLHARPVDQGGTGDARLMDRLLKSLTLGSDGKGRRKSIVHVEGIVAWCSAFSPIVWNADGNVKMIKAESKGYKWDIAKAIKTPFWEVAGQAPVTKFSIETMLKIMAGMGKRLDTAIENERFEGDEVNARKVANLAEETAKRLAKQLGVDLNAKPKAEAPATSTTAKETVKNIARKARAPKATKQAEGEAVREAA